MTRADGVLAALLGGSHTLPPDDLPAFVTRVLADHDMGDAVLYLVDYDQRRLVPLPGEGVPSREALDIDATMGGRSFRTLEILDAPAGEDTRMWVPLLDGTARVGVVEITVRGLDEDTLQTASSVGSLLAELVVTKNAYGDAFTILRRRDEMTLAAEMQWNLLPPLTFSSGSIVITGMLEPSHEIAGDTFDYAHNGTHLHLAIFDAMGHGFEATQLATVAVGSYRHSRRRRLSLAETYSAMDRAISEHFPMEQFVTAQIVDIDTSTGRLSWLNAGHPAPLLVRGGSAVGVLSCEPTPPVGFGGAVAEIATDQLEPGDHLLFFTDGVIEARAPSGEFFGEARLADLLTRAIGADLPLPETVRRLGLAILDHQEGELQDDATTLCVKWLGPP